MAVQEYLQDYSEISYHIVGDLAWRLRLNTNFSLSTTTADVVPIFAALHTPLLNTVPEGTIVRGYGDGDLVNRSYIASNNLITDFVANQRSNVFTTEQVIYSGVESEGVSVVVLGKRTEVFAIPQGSTYTYIREINSAAKELYFMASSNNTVGGEFILDRDSSNVLGLSLLAGVVEGPAGAGQVGFTVNNISDIDSELLIENNTGSTINIIMNKEA